MIIRCDFSININEFDVENEFIKYDQFHNIDKNCQLVNFDKNVFMNLFLI